MDVAVVGGGGREHVLTHLLSESDDVDTAYCLGDNPGADRLESGMSVPIDSTDVSGIVSFAQQEQLGLVVVGPEAPAILGLGDALRAAGIRTVCPSQPAAQFEGSKIRFQEFTKQHDIPAPRALAIARSRREALNFVERHDPQEYVAKADGEAGGKGVGVYDSAEEMRDFVSSLLDGAYNNAARRGIVFQERIPLSHPEVSTYALIDRNGTILEFKDAAQDHKRVGEGDTGPNTGGTGAYSDVPLAIYTQAQREENTRNTEKFVTGAQAEGINYEGVLYQARMGSVVLEYNVRFGDPEAQVILPRLHRAGVNIHELLMATAEGKLDQVSIPKQLGETAVTFALMAEYYPGPPTTGDIIHGLDQDYGDDIMIYHGGTQRASDGSIRTAGGRVLYVTAFGSDVADARAKGLRVVGRDNGGIYFRGMHFRSDIGHQAIAA